MGFWNKFKDFLGYEIVRNRDDKGRYVGDDKSTPDVDESKKRVYKSRTNTPASNAKKKVSKKSSKKK